MSATVKQKDWAKIDWFPTTPMSMPRILLCLYILTQQHTPTNTQQHFQVTLETHLPSSM